MAEGLRQLGGLRVSKTENGERYEAKFLVSESELSRYEPQIYDPVNWTPVECVVSSYSKSKSGNSWELNISTEPRIGGSFSQKNNFMIW